MSITNKVKYENVTNQIFITILLNMMSTVISFVIRYMGYKEVPIVLTYLLSVLFTSRYTKGYVYGIAASVISMLSFNFFFTVPLYSFNVDDKTYIFTFFVMFISAIFTSTLTSKLIRSNEMAYEREREAKILYNITSSLAKASEVSEIAAVSARSLSNIVECDVICLLLNLKENSAKKLTIEYADRKFTNTEVKLDEIEEILEKYYSIPIKVRDKNISFICLPKKLEKMINEYRVPFDSIIMQITNAMERELLKSEKEAAKSEIQNERFKSSMLRAISHDLRTPLTRISGAAEMLTYHLKDDGNIKLASEIYQDSIWLTHLVENILNLTRIQEGRLTINMKSEAVEEIIAESIGRISKYYKDHKILIDVPDEILFVQMDGKLIEQVLINLIENAIKHTTPSNEIKLTVWCEKNKVWFEVYNEGEEIDADDLPKLFDMFFIGKDLGLNLKRGMGLGLAICKSIVNYHNGEIYAENKPSGGVAFKFYLNI